MKKKIIKKIIALIIVLLLSFSIVACDNNGSNNGSNNGNDKPVITLPDENNTLEKEKDEIIYVNMNQNGNIDSIKTTNRIKNSVFSYYKDYGKFLTTGNLNITSGKGPILIEEDYALIPSLQEDKNMFYTLNLNNEHYEPLLPFIITSSYKLNGDEVTYQELKNATGEVTLNFNFQSNANANSFYINNFAAQVQIPINIDNADIISAQGSMQQILIGKEISLVYMIMPGTNANIEIVLDAYNFSFAGLQAVLQPFEISSMLEFLSIDDLGDFDFDLDNMPDQLDILINTLEDEVKTQLDPLFVDLFPNLNEIPNQLSMLDQLEDLVDGLNNPLLQTPLSLLTRNTSYRAGFTDNRHLFVTPVSNIELGITNLNNQYLLLQYALNNLDLNYDLTPVVDEYQLLYSLFDEVIEELKNIKLKLNTLASYDELTLGLLINEKENFITLFNNIGDSSDLIKTNLQTLIKGMFVLPNKLEPLLGGLAQIANPLIDFFNIVEDLYDDFSFLAVKIKEGLDNDWFSIISKTIISAFYDSLVKEEPIDSNMDVEDLGLLQGLELILIAKQQLVELEEVKDLYKVDLETGFRQIDMIGYAFIQINEGLSLVQENEEISFYEGMDLIKQLPLILELIPEENNNDPLPSFLSNLNVTPKTVQFIYKQQGF